MLEIVDTDFIWVQKSKQFDKLNSILAVLRKIIQGQRPCCCDCGMICQICNRYYDTLFYLHSISITFSRIPEFLFRWTWRFRACRSGIFGGNHGLHIFTGPLQTMVAYLVLAARICAFVMAVAIAILVAKRASATNPNATLLTQNTIIFCTQASSLICNSMAYNPTGPPASCDRISRSFRTAPNGCEGGVSTPMMDSVSMAHKAEMCGSKWEQFRWRECRCPHCADRFVPMSPVSWSISEPDLFRYERLFCPCCFPQPTLKWPLPPLPRMSQNHISTSTFWMASIRAGRGPGKNSSITGRHDIICVWTPAKTGKASRMNYSSGWVEQLMRLTTTRSTIVRMNAEGWCGPSSRAITHHDQSTPSPRSSKLRDIQLMACYNRGNMMPTWNTHAQLLYSTAFRPFLPSPIMPLRGWKNSTTRYSKSGLTTRFSAWRQYTGPLLKKTSSAK